MNSSGGKGKGLDFFESGLFCGFSFRTTWSILHTNETKVFLKKESIEIKSKLS